MPRLTRTHLAILLLILTAVFLLFLHETLRLPDPALVTVRFFDVGQGDSIFITGPAGEQILVDGGPDLRALEHIEKAMPFLDRSIDLLVLSHPHLDHVASFPEILRRYKVKQVLISGAAYNNGPYEEFLSLLKKEEARVIIAAPNQHLTFGGGMTLDVLWPLPVYFGKAVKEIHDTNVVTKLRYGSDSLLLTGDMEIDAEQSLLDAKTDVSATVLKVAHHGSKTSSSSGFLLAVNPKLAVISVAAKNKYGLPYPATLRRLSDFHIPYKMTMSGTVIWRMDGKEGL